MRNPRFHALLQQMAEMHDRKSHDYAADENPYSNFELAARYAGVDVDTVFRVLLGIKEARLHELTTTGKVPNNESIADTRLDQVVYAALRTSYHMKMSEGVVSAQPALP